MTDFKKEARGRDCQIRIPGVCNFNPETTVLTHYRMSGTCGMGIKPDDLQAAWGCSACHDEVDRRTRHIDSDTARLYHAEGVMRTQAVLIEEGKF
ncbi:DUF1364 domain-containing protein [Symbiopectobacterium purcellii]|uniref:DUF1364 domain-containing protein n=1 Tax=Symbiopectobacterium purcellii TaxID=2871826 RepID=UPI003F84EBA0